MFWTEEYFELIKSRKIINSLQIPDCMHLQENIFYGIDSNIEDDWKDKNKMLEISKTEDKYEFSNLSIDLILSSKIKEKLYLYLKYYSFTIYDNILEIKNLSEYQFKLKLNDLWNIILLHPNNSYKNWWINSFLYFPDSFDFIVKNDINTVWIMIEKIKKNENKGNILIKLIQILIAMKILQLWFFKLLYKMKLLSI